MEKTYKRKTREVSPETKQKISSALRNYNVTHPRKKEQNDLIAQRFERLLETDTEIIRFI